MTTAQQAQQHNRGRAGRYAEKQLADPGDAGLGAPVVDAPLPAPKRFDLALKPGARCEMDVGRGPEMLVVLGQTDVNGRRFLQAETDGSLFEVGSKRGEIGVTATPEQLSARARLVAAFYNGDIVDVCTEWRHRGHTGFTHKQHLASCPFAHLHPEESAKVTVETFPQAWRKDRIGCLNKLLEQHRNTAEGNAEPADTVCDCIRLAEAK